MPEGIGPDGHPKRGGFLPPVHDLPRRMWAGGRVGFTGVALRAGDAVRRTSTILSVADKAGGSGRLVFVTVKHVVEGPRGIAIEEEQDIVYRGAEGAAVKAADPAPAWPDAVTRQVLPDPVMLFRYSALTFNSHRIHYDRSYVTEVEGYPGLVVHGPLVATMLMQLAQQALPQRRVAAFSFRALMPLFDIEPFGLHGRLSDDGGSVMLWAANARGELAMQAQATLKQDYEATEE
jgi:hydroxyacyl-ACP dehydratase HTD2-like protein with hotdog domain